MPDEIRILIVDDNEDLTRIIAFILKAEGYQVAICNSLSTGFNEIYSFHPDLLLLDVNIANEDGRELCFKVKNDGSLNTKVVLMSGDETLITSSMADGHITKPFDTIELLNIINSLVKVKMCN